MSDLAREWRLVRRPSGYPVPEDVELVEVPGPGAREPGKVLVRNAYVSVDPYMRGRMNDAASYAAPYQLGQGDVGRRRRARRGVGRPALPVGAAVRHGLGWRTHAVSSGRASWSWSTSRRRR